MMIRTKNLYVDIHILQNLPPSCVNRDDTGSPKTAVYGGVTRARVSSQSWKRAVRVMFRDVFPQEKLGTRTLKIVAMVADEISRLAPEMAAEQAEQAAQGILEMAGLKLKSSKEGSGALFFMSGTQAKKLAQIAVDLPESETKKPSREAKKLAADALKEEPGVDVALFGRMVADPPTLNVDACAQVAHSISTHAVTTEFDYFTAVDDLAPEDNVGAGHIGTVEFNSATLYRYATVAVHELYKYLGNDTNAALTEFVRAFALSMPTGKQNTFAKRTLPEALLVAIRTDQPINLVGAFEKPIFAAGDGYLKPSAKSLVEHAEKAYATFVSPPETSLITGDLLADLGKPLPFNLLLQELSEKINQIFEMDGTIG